jgi:hypothetical protein
MLKLSRARDDQSNVPLVKRSADELTSERVRKVLEIWEAKCTQSGLPPVEQFDILDYGAAMANINLITVQQDPLDFIFRVHSVKGAGYVGRDMTGRSVDDYPEPQYRRFARAIFTETVASRAPVVVVEDLFMTDNRLMRWECVTLPLQDREGRVASLLAAFELL